MSRTPRAAIALPEPGARIRLIADDPFLRAAHHAAPGTMATVVAHGVNGGVSVRFDAGSELVWLGADEYTTVLTSATSEESAQPAQAPQPLPGQSDRAYRLSDLYDADLRARDQQARQLAGQLKIAAPRA